MDAPSGSAWEPINPPTQPVPHKSSKSRKSHKSATNPAPSAFPLTGATGSPQVATAYPSPGMAFPPPHNPNLIPRGPEYQGYYPGSPAGMYGGPGVNMGYPAPGMTNQIPGYFADPLANVAMAYGQNLAGQGKELVNQNLEKWISISTIKFYFAVDTKYVARKLFVLFLPFFVRDWSIKFPPSQCVAPREEANAPDLYIPTMGFITYILATGVLLGLQNRFTPEHLGGQASESLAWTIVEILLVLFTFYITNISSNLRFLHLLAFTGYKYVGMVACVLASMFLQRWGYRIVMFYASAAIVYFFLRSLKVYVLPEVTRVDQDHAGNKRRIWALLFITTLQPIMIFLMTRQICSYESPVALSSQLHL